VILGKCRRRILAGGVALALLVGACGSPPSPSPSAAAVSPTGTTAATKAAVSPTAVQPAGLGFTWEAASVEQPASVTDEPSVAPSFCSPCHGQATLLFGVARASFGLLAVGVQEPPARAAAWLSQDGKRWARAAAFPAVEGSVAVATAADGDRAIVVGSDHAGALAWVTTDGVAWSQSPHSAALAGPAGGTHMLTAVAWRGGFVAGGSHDDPAAGRTAGAIWTSPDGLTWQRVSTDAAFDGTRVLGLAADADTLVAVGTNGDQTQGSAVAWVSHDGRRWDRVTSPALAAGIMRAVAAGGPGFVAVGLGSADDRAQAWVSPDGSDWQAVPDDPGLHVGRSSLRMYAVAPLGQGFAAGGWTSDAGNGSAVAWVSPDGLRWQRAPGQTTFFGAEITGVVAAGPVLVAVGTSGYPDNDTASAWTSRL
jgi:hypothetical protein